MCVSFLRQTGFIQLGSVSQTDSDCLSDLQVWVSGMSLQRTEKTQGGGHEGGERDVEESRTGYCPPSEQHVSTASALPDCQMK